MNKPMLAVGRPAYMSNKEYDAIIDKHMPLIVTPKLDGIRCLVSADGALTRTLKPLPNKDISRRLVRAFNTIDEWPMVRSWCEDNDCELLAIDGELTVSGVSDVFSLTMSTVMSNKPWLRAITYNVFDVITTKGSLPYSKRINVLYMLNTHVWDMLAGVHFKWLCGRMVYSRRELADELQKKLDDGYEGLIGRTPGSPYKHGRSTLLQGWMLKFKKMNTCEVMIYSYAALRHNDNEEKRDATGAMCRATCKDHMIEQELLGAVHGIVVNGPFAGQKVAVGSGFTAEMRKTLWKCKDTLKGMIIEVKHMPYGSQKTLRHPIFLRFRAKDDVTVMPVAGINFSKALETQTDMFKEN